MRDRQGNARRMSALVGRWRGSGRTLSWFARANGVTRGKLEYWRRRLDAAPGRARRSKPGAGVVFAPVELVPTSMAARAVEVTLSDGVRVLIDNGTAPELVAAVLGVLRRGC